YGQYDIPIRTRVIGFLDKIYFQEGTYVKKNQLLYTIDPQSLQEKLARELSNLAEAKTQLAKAESDLGRIKPLAKINAVSKSDLDAAQAQYDAAIANVNAVESGVNIAKINLSYCNIISPLNGLIGKTEAKVGEFVGQNPNPVILNTVSTIDTIHVEFYIAETEYLGLANKFIENERKNKINPINKQKDDNGNLELILSDNSVFKYKGKVNFIGREVNPETGSMLIQTSFPNPDKVLRPGQYAKVRAKMNVIKGALVIPQRCIMELQGTHSVYVVNDSSKIEKRQVITGQKYEDYWIIQKGLEPNERVVIDALQKVQPGMPVIPKKTVFKNEATPI
ncbi:MAG: efflux RND transporter periplasmic adaptor subunit, partial [Bacteroidales bacterium]|nr:efflux RND transporter periplasmic adaptor subunit [Bacteroidales bacterium]